MKTSEYTATPIHIPAPLRSYTGGQSTINVNGGSVEEALSDLGFSCDDDSISLNWNAPKDFGRALDAAKRSARK